MENEVSMQRDFRIRPWNSAFPVRGAWREHAAQDDFALYAP